MSVDVGINSYGNTRTSFDTMDDGDPTVPPQFSCEECGGEMYPEYYKGAYGYEYRIIDRLGKKEVEGSN
jgi:hypothetical protein